MPSDSNGIYSLPAGYLAVTGETILASQHNPPLEDIKDALTARLMRSGVAPMTGPLLAAVGSAGAPGITFAAFATRGLFKTTNGIGVSVGGAQVAEFDSTGLVSGIASSSIPDKAITLRKLYHPSAASLLLGTNANAALTITGAADSGSGEVRLTVASTATFTTGESKTVSDVTGTTEANGTWTITVVDGTHIDLDGSTFANAWVSGGTIGGGVDEIIVGAGLTMSNRTLKSGFAPAASFKNLVIKVTGNTGVDVDAEFVVTTDGTSYQTTAVNSSIDLSGNGAADRLDAGTIAQATWYALWVIAKADGTTACLASLSATAPTLPSGYTYKARVGWVRTAAGAAQLLGTWQFGRKAQYILGLAQTSILPLMVNGAVGTYATNATAAFVSQSISNFVPSTASEIDIQWTNDYDGAARSMIAAPNTSYQGPGTTKPPPIHAISSAIASGRVNWVLESTNIYFAATGDGGALLAAGWTDNI